MDTNLKQLKSGILSICMVMMSVGSLWAQDDISVTGKVVDEGGLPLEGVVVMLAGQNGTGVITDAAGQFRLNAPLSSSLSFLCMGYSDLIVKVPAGGVLNVVMKEDAQALDEVVVVGYGSQRKKDLTGGLTVVSEETLNMGSTSNLMDRLVGQVAGLSITTGNEAPGSNQTLLIRGQNSLSGSNSPLIVLDGIPYDGSLADIDPNIIESMSVLKDASSVAIYGSRGSNGVILLQTKQGQQGKVNVTYKGKFGLSQPMQEIQVMGPNEYLRFKQDMGRLGKNAYTGVQLDPLYGDVISASEKINFAKGVTNDWQSYVFREVFTMDHQLSFTGGTDKTSYMASVSYLQNPGVVYNSNYDRINVFATITQRLNNWLKVGLTSQFVHRESGGLTPNLEHAIKQSPYGVYKDETGMFYKEPMDYSNFPNPMKDVNADSKNTGRNVLMNGFVEITPLEGLSLKSQFGYNYRNTFSGTYYGRNTITGKENNGSASISNSTTTDWTWENVVRYEKEIGKHRFDLTGLFSMQQKMNVSSSQSGTGFVNDDSSFYRMDGAEKNIKISSGYWKESMMSGMLRVNYGYASKYMVTLTGRADGASVFGKNNKYAFFPSVALAWHLGDEDFIKDNVTWIDMLKLRVSYGANGNNAISRYQTLDRLYSTNGVKYIWGDGSTAVNAAYLASDGVGNPDLRWETTYTANIGLDFAFINGRLGGSVDVYQSRTKDILMTRTVPIMNGYSKMWDNIGETRNTGVELTLNSVNVRKKDFTWETDLNFFMNKDEIIELRGDQIDDINNKWFIGYPLSVFYDYNVVGIWQNSDQFTYVDEDGNEIARQKGAKAGDAKLEDVNGNGYIDEGDRKVIGSKRPAFTMSMGNRFRFHDFYCSILLNGVFGKWMQDNVANVTSYTFGAGNYIAGAKYWTPETPEADYVSPGYQQQFSHEYYKKMHYLQIKNITLGYTMPKFVAGKIGMAGIDVNVSVNNVHTFSNMRQMLNYDNTWFASFPTARSYMLGLTLTF